LSCGYRFFDTAQVYGNEAALGRVFKELLPKYDLEREDIFITSKVSPANQGTDLARKSIKKSLANLQTDYIDLMLIHWPGTSKKSVTDKQNPVKRRQTYEVLEEYHDSGELRAIGVSNYEIRHLEELLEHCKVHPAVNQVRTVFALGTRCRNVIFAIWA
ncbi:glyoxal reductase domain protein, partial [Ancylostoma duodenale]